ncbi:succinylglutamate desuccinylase/aspartoacylase family protein [Crocinitomix algicola]|uniref:succinylglutamate desuccinylase/aspartoacylase family protein n=1 Tax=Crocinitomix algicola TaxID=1740263 RepID=UPI00087346BD|nr:succinylglutamate desuccinylase/aspartoacylase family protein [Crocinitomix algicola]
MKINNITVNPGENVTIQIPVANLPSGTEINLFAHVYRSKKPGPTLLVTGGVHGDEVNGIEIVRRAVREKLFNKLKAGAVIAVPLLNVYGFINFSRGFPDGKDVNRSFPGTKSGSLAARIAYVFTTEILPFADLALDFHTGGKSIHNFPQARYTGDDERSYKLAKDLNMPLIIKSSLIARSLRKTAYSKNIPMVVFEGGESLRIDENSIAEGLRGLRNVLIGQGMIKGKQEINPTIELETKLWIRANRAGIFSLEKKSGDYVKKGDVLGRITDPYNTYQSKVSAKNDGFIFGHNNNPVVNKGDALFHIGF